MVACVGGWVVGGGVAWVKTRHRGQPQLQAAKVGCTWGCACVHAGCHGSALKGGRKKVAAQAPLKAHVRCVPVWASTVYSAL